MSNAAKAHEPTMEEILASIRRIIADDEPAAEAKPAASAAKAAAPAAAAKPAPAPPPPAAEEPSAELGQDDIDAMLASFDAPAVPGKDETKPAPAAKDEDVLDLTKPVAKPAEEVEFREPAKVEPESEPEMDAWAAAEAAEEEEEAAPPPPPAFKPISTSALARDVGETLLAPEAGDAVSSAFSSLAHTILAQNARTLDDLVQEMLRPMLKSWLDDNLPTIVERLVRAEIERVSRGPRR
jgi:uncharacterized protein